MFSCRYGAGHWWRTRTSPHRRILLAVATAASLLSLPLILPLLATIRPRNENLAPPEQRQRAEDGKTVPLLRRPPNASVAVPIPSAAAVVTNISRDPAGVTVTTDVRGNLGPPAVLVQDPPGADWIADRWQAASDMHGTSIPGVHWVMLEFPSPVTACARVVLDWEAAFARDYRIEVSNSGSIDAAGGIGDDGDWTVLFDSHVDSARRTTRESGQSPGVKTKTPLHVVHTVVMSDGDDARHRPTPFKYLRVYIRKSAMGWGVSLWQVDVYGTTMTTN